METVLRADAFEGETHIVTGAAQGIGNQVAATLAVHGASVVMVDLDPGRLEDARAEIAGDVSVAPIAVAANVADEDDVKRAVGSALEANGCINGLVNVAGITKDARITKKSFDEYKQVLVDRGFKRRPLREGGFPPGANGQSIDHRRS